MKKIILAAIIAATGLTSCNNGQPKANLKSDIDTLTSASRAATQPMLTNSSRATSTV